MASALRLSQAVRLFKPARAVACPSSSSSRHPVFFVRPTVSSSPCRAFFARARAALAASESLGAKKKGKNSGTSSWVEASEAFLSSGGSGGDEKLPSRQQQASNEKPETEEDTENSHASGYGRMRERGSPSLERHGHSRDRDDKKGLFYGVKGRVTDRKASYGDRYTNVKGEHKRHYNERGEQRSDRVKAFHHSRYDGGKKFNPQIGARPSSGSAYDWKRNAARRHEDHGLEEEEDDDSSMAPPRERRELASTGSSIPKIKGEVVYGVGPVYAALQISRRELFCLYVQENMPMDRSNASKKKDKKALEWILKSAIGRGLQVEEISKHDLNMLADNRPHQGLVLDASSLELVHASELEMPEEDSDRVPVWVALDEVTDPQNFGAILRSAYFLGASGVVVCAKNSAPLSAVVSKASAGAMEVMEIRSCRNMVKFLERSIDNGWRVVGTAAAGKGTIPIRELPHGVPTVLVLGGEGKGLRTNVKRACEHLVSIPGIAFKGHSKVAEDQGHIDGEAADPDVAHRKDVENDLDDTDNYENEEMEGVFPGDAKGEGEEFVAVESLNVSVAAGILLHELVNVQPANGSSIPGPGSISRGKKQGLCRN